MSEFSLIKSVREYKPKENKPKIDYTPFDVIVEGKSVSVGIPTRVAKEFEDFLSENHEEALYWPLVHVFIGNTCLGHS